MNSDRVRELADFIEKSDTFEMNRYFKDNPEVPCCIAGHAVALFNPEALIANNDDEPMIEDAARQALDIVDEPVIAVNLFHPDGDGVAWWADTPSEREFITKSHAVKTLRHLADSGTVDWKKTK